MTAPAPETRSPWSALDADIERLIRHAAVTPRYRQVREHQMERFDAFCAERGWTGLGAPIEAFEALTAAAARGWLTLEEQPKEGKACEPWSAGYLRSFASAVRMEHQAAGLTAAIDEPEHAARWLTAISGYRVNEASRGRAVKHTVPMERDDVATMLGAPLPRDARDLALAAVAFLNLDYNCTWESLLGLRPDQVVNDEATVVLPLASGGTAIQHSHDVTDPLLDPICTACLVIEWSMHPEARDLARDACEAKDDNNKRARYNTWVKRQARRHHAVQAQPGRQRWSWIADLSGTARDGARYGLWASTAMNLPRHLSRQAWLAISWSVGLRGGSEPKSLRRRDIEREADDRFRFALGKSKADQRGDGVGFGLTVSPSGDDTIVRAIARWCAVWDATGPLDGSGFAFCSFTSVGGDLKHDKQRLDTSGRADIKRLAADAGLDPVWTPHSTRSGFAQTAHRDGRDVQDISVALRHSNVSSTHRYLDSMGATAEQTGMRVANVLGRES